MRGHRGRGWGGVSSLLPLPGVSLLPSGTVIFSLCCAPSYPSAQHSAHLTHSRYSQMFGE